MSPATQAPADVLGQLLAKLGVDADIATKDGEPIVLEINTDEDAARLIGHRGETIAAIQHLVRVMLHQAGKDASVVVDVDGYRERQHEQLKELARRKAQEVRETGQATTLAPMTSYERRLVHLELKDAEGVLTESLGQGGNRRISIKKQD